MRERALIFGSSGHARVIASLIHVRYKDITFVTLDGSHGSLAESLVFADSDRLRASVDVYLGIGDNQIRRRLFEQLAEARFELPSCIADRVFVAHDAVVEKSALLCPGAVVMSGARVGRNVIVNTNSSVDHDCEVGDHTQIAAGVSLGGATKIETNCFLGMRCATLPGIRIGSNSHVMAGSLVVKDIPADVVAGGYPAVIVRRL